MRAGIGRWKEIGGVHHHAVVIVAESWGTCNGNVWNLTMGVEIQVQVQNRGTMGIIGGENHRRNGAYPREGKVPLMDSARGQQESHNDCKEMMKVA